MPRIRWNTHINDPNIASNRMVSAHILAFSIDKKTASVGGSGKHVHFQR